MVTLSYVIGFIYVKFNVKKTMIMLIVNSRLVGPLCPDKLSKRKKQNPCSGHSADGAGGIWRKWWTSCPCRKRWEWGEVEEIGILGGVAGLTDYLVMEREGGVGGNGGKLGQWSPLEAGSVNVKMNLERCK